MYKSRFEKFTEQHLKDLADVSVRNAINRGFGKTHLVVTDIDAVANAPTSTNVVTPENFSIADAKNFDFVMLAFKYEFPANIAIVKQLTTHSVKYIGLDVAFSLSRPVDIDREVHDAIKIAQDAQVGGGWAKPTTDWYDVLQAIDNTKDVQGCFVEIGTFMGSTMAVVLEYMKAKGIKKDTYTLDTFEGFAYDAARNSSDVVWVDSHVVDQKTVTDRLKKFDPAVNVIKNNIITDDLPKEVVSNGIAVAFLDVDIYEGVLAGFKKLAPHINPGGILIAEDAGHCPLLYGARLATNEFADSDIGKKFMKIYMASGQTWFVRK